MLKKLAADFQTHIRETNLVLQTNTTDKADKEPSSVSQNERPATSKFVAPSPVGKLTDNRTFLQKVTGRLRHYVEVAFGKIYDRRHPGAFVCWLTSALCPLFALLTPNDKWSLGAHLPYWFKALKAAQSLPLPQRKRIFMFCNYRIQFTLDLTIAVLLAWRGHEITFGYLPNLQSPVKPPLDDHKSAKPYLARVLGKAAALSGGRITCIDLSDEKLLDIPLNEEIIASKVKSDVVMFVRRETLDLTDPEMRKWWDYYEDKSRYAQQLARSYFSRTRNDFDLCLIANGTTFEGAQFCFVAKDIGLPVNTYEKFAFRNIRILNHGDDFQNFNDLNEAWNRRAELKYLVPEFFAYATDRAYGLLEERRTASKATWAWALQSSPLQNTQDSLRAAGIPANTEFVLVCPNVPYDAGYSGLLGLFGSMKEWLLITVSHLLHNTTMHVVVRAHPAEGASWGGLENSGDTLSEFINHPRLTFISHDRAVNTYGLMETCKFGVVFSSTTGLEMAMMGKPVMVGANMYYSGKGFTIDSSNQTQYRATLTKLVDSPHGEIPQAQKLDARLFHFILHYIVQWPFPYNKPSGIRLQPPHLLLKSGEIKRFQSFFDAMTLSENEWASRMPEFISADGRGHVPIPK